MHDAFGARDGIDITIPHVHSITGIAISPGTSVTKDRDAKNNRPAAVFHTCTTEGRAKK
jgi:hypothetical protein